MTHFLHVFFFFAELQNGVITHTDCWNFGIKFEQLFIIVEFYYFIS